MNGLRKFFTYVWPIEKKILPAWTVIFRSLG
jgi:hypothetical protein